MWAVYSRRRVRTGQTVSFGMALPAPLLTERPPGCSPTGPEVRCCCSCGPCPGTPPRPAGGPKSSVRALGYMEMSIVGTTRNFSTSWSVLRYVTTHASEGGAIARTKDRPGKADPQRRGPERGPRAGPAKHRWGAPQGVSGRRDVRCSTRKRRSQGCAGCRAEGESGSAASSSKARQRERQGPPPEMSARHTSCRALRLSWPTALPDMPRPKACSPDGHAGPNQATGRPSHTDP